MKDFSDFDLGVNRPVNTLGVNRGNDVRNKAVKSAPRLPNDWLKARTADLAKTTGMAPPIRYESKTNIYIAQANLKEKFSDKYVNSDFILGIVTRAPIEGAKPEDFPEVATDEVYHRSEGIKTTEDDIYSPASG